MKYTKIITLKNGRACCLRNGTGQDGQTVSDLFVATHGQTDYLLSYPEEHSFTVTQECEFLEERSKSENEIMLLAEVEGTLVGTAGIEAENTRCAIGQNLASALTGNIGALGLVGR